ncbi:hypothetical protein C8J56DRAFT_1049789 [Mycena floridula]|nr:hypothetical protein C8J56DRAFT_1052412 [Mycena floridula]KAJ7588865.1 hypothetical protein C8J56DRAFT_1049789 [Mycena floridula]
MPKASGVFFALRFVLPSLTKALTISVDNPAILNSVLPCHWQANSSDPDPFILFLGAVNTNSVSQLVRTKDEASGDQTLPPVNILGYTMTASSTSNPRQILDQTSYEVIVVTFLVTSQPIDSSLDRRACILLRRDPGQPIQGSEAEIQ